MLCYVMLRPFCDSSHRAARHASFASDFSGTFTGAGIVILTANHVIKLSTISMFAAVRAVRGRPLPDNLASLPV